MTWEQKQEIRELKDEIKETECKIGEIKGELLHMEARRDELERKIVSANKLALKRKFIDRISGEINEKYGAMDRLEGELEGMKYMLEEMEALV